jgi:hypothetical protein
MFCRNTIKRQRRGFWAVPKGQFGIYVPIALDVLTEILLDVGLLERIVPIREKSCQGVKGAKIS